MPRVNLCTNPGFTRGASGWTGAGGATVAASADPAPWGGSPRQSPAFLAVTVGASVDAPRAVGAQVRVPDGAVWIAASALVRTSSGVMVAFQPRFLAAGKPVSAPALVLMAGDRDGVRPSWAVRVPDGATAVVPVFSVHPAPGGRALRVGDSAGIDEVLVVAAPTLDQAVADASPYFDGDTPRRRVGSTGRAWAYSWTGAAGASASREEAATIDMGVPVALVEDGDAPRVQIVIPAQYAPAGVSCEVTGRTPSGFTWTPRGGRWEGTGGQRVLADALAPINTPVVYRLTTSSGTAFETAPITRPWRGLSLMTSATGTMPVDCVWQGRDARELKPRLTEHEIPGRPTPVVVYAPTMGAGTVSLTARTNRGDTPAMRALLGTPTPVALFHNPARCVQCRLGACDVDPVTLMAVTSASMERAPRLDVAERTWTLKGALIGLPQPATPLALSSWNDFDGVGLTWVDLDRKRWAWDRFDRTLWQEEGR